MTISDPGFWVTLMQIIGINIVRTIFIADVVMSLDNGNDLDEAVEDVGVHAALPATALR